MNILVADDDVLLAAALERALRGAGCSVETVSNGTLALAKLRESRFDVLITDWAMPGLDGVALTREAKLLPHCPRVIFYTAFHQPEAKVHAMNAGADVYLEKPTPLRVVLERVQGVRAAAKSSARLLAVTTQPSPVDSLHRLVATNLWRGFNAFAATHLSEATRRSLSSVQTAKAAPTMMVRSLGMIDSKAGIELQSTIGYTKDHGSLFIQSLLQLEATDTETLADLLFELSNTILGYMGMTLSGHGFSFAMSVPSASQAAVAVWDNETSVALSDGRADLFVDLRARARGSEWVRASSLRENMVVAEDVCSPIGALLVPGGTRLSTTTAERIARHLPTATFRVVTLT
jgi:DNA-binding response OmpR family regulator